MKSIVKSQDLRNAALSAIAFLSKPALHLLVTPFLLFKLGDEGFGLWMILQSLMALTNMADLGIAPATTLFIARYDKMDESDSVSRILRGSWALYAVICVALFLFLSVTTPFLLKLMNAEILLEERRLFLVFLFSLCVISQLFQGLLDAVLRGFERYDQESILRVITNMLSLGGISLAALLNYGIHGMLLVQSAVYSLCICLSIVLISLRVRSLKWLIPYSSRSTLHEIFHVGIYGGLQGVFSVLFSQVDRLMVAALMGPVIMGYYSACIQITQLTHGLLARSLNFLFPKFAGIPKEDRVRSYNVFRKGMILSTTAGCVISLLLFYPAHWILQTWLKDSLPDDLTQTFQILAIVNALYATTIVPYNLLMGQGSFHLGALFSFLSFVLVASASMVLIPLYGILGAAIAKLFFLPSSILSRKVIMKLSFGTSRWSDGIQQLLPVGICFGTAILTGNLLHLYTPLLPIHLWLTGSFFALALMTLTIKKVYRLWIWESI